MRLDRLDAATAHALLAGDLAGRRPRPGWPHEDTAPGLTFVDPGGAAFLVIDDEGRIAGECGTKAPPDADGMVEIGYGLGTGSRGRGLGTEAVAALVAWLRSVPASVGSRPRCTPTTSRHSACSSVRAWFGSTTPPSATSGTASTSAD